MGARTLSSFQYSLERDVVALYGRGIGAAGVSFTGVKGKGITSIVRTGVGLHTITLDDKWMGLLDFNAIVVGPTTDGHWEVSVVSETVNSTKTILIAIWGAATGVAPALKDLPATSRLQFTATLSNSSQVPQGF